MNEVHALHATFSLEKPFRDVQIKYYERQS
jgi:hypothetical protein